MLRCLNCGHLVKNPEVEDLCPECELRGLVPADAELTDEELEQIDNLHSATRQYIQEVLSHSIYYKHKDVDLQLVNDVLESALEVMRKRDMLINYPTRYEGEDQE